MNTSLLLNEMLLSSDINDKPTIMILLYQKERKLLIGRLPIKNHKTKNKSWKLSLSVKYQDVPIVLLNKSSSFIVNIIFLFLADILISDMSKEWT